MQQWLLLTVAVLGGSALGLGAFTFSYARGYSYLLDEPSVCANCHIMEDHYGAWLKSSHRAVATCNGCHTPHATIPKYYVKAKNGFWHSFYFTTGNFPDPLRITPPNHEVVEANCRDCHDRITQAIEHGAPSTRGAQTLECTSCHRYVGHWLR